MSIIMEIKRRLETPTTTQEIEEFVVINSLDGESTGWASPEHKCIILSLSEIFTSLTYGYKNVRGILPSLSFFESFFLMEFIALQTHEILHIISPELKERDILTLTKKLVDAT